MNKKLAISLLATGLLTTFSSQAENNWYLGAQYSAHNVELANEDRFNAIGIVGGLRINGRLSFETRANFSLTSNDFDVRFPEGLSARYKQELDYQVSFLAKYNVINYGDFKAYGLAGYSAAQISMTSPVMVLSADGGFVESTGLNRDHDENGLTYGIGAEYVIDDQFSVFVDYQVLPDFTENPLSDRSWDNWNIGVNYNF